MNRLTYSLLVTLSIAYACKTTNSSAKMVGGTPVANDQWEAKHTVVLLTGSGTQLCTATRIGQNVLVTAGHCVTHPIPGLQIGYGGAVDKAAGAALADSPVVAKSPVAVPGIKVLAMIPDPRFGITLPDGEGNDHDDIGLVFFEGDLPVEITPIASFADFPTADSDLAKAPVKSLVKAGFGKKSDTDTTAASLDAGPLIVDHLDPDARELEFKPHLKTGTCAGDSGGPAYLAVAKDANSPVQPKLIGVTSRGPDEDSLSASSTGIGDCDDGNGIDTDARYYRAWIQGTSMQVINRFVSEGHTLYPLQLTTEPADHSGDLLAATKIESLAEALARAKAVCETSPGRSYDQVEGGCEKAQKATNTAGTAG